MAQQHTLTAQRHQPPATRPARITVSCHSGVSRTLLHNTLSHSVNRHLQHSTPASHNGRRQCRQRQCIVRAAGGSADDPQRSFEEAFAAEVASRQAAEAQQAEVAAAAVFDGPALLALLRKKYGRSYDVSLVQRTYLGKVFVALNVMWKYQEQQSFSYTEEQYMQRLEYVAAALVSWGAVTTVQSQLASTKERPRVGKAVSIMLDVPEEKAREWIAV